jgi:hypothetical protein
MQQQNNEAFYFWKNRTKDFRQGELRDERDLMMDACVQVNVCKISAN